MRRRAKGPLRQATKRATALYLHGALAKSVETVGAARKRASAQRNGLPADEVAALAEGWELQARVELDKGRLQSALESFAEAERILEGLAEHNELRGRICFQVAQQLAGVVHMSAVREEYMARARTLLTGSAEYGFLLKGIADGLGGEREPWHVRRAHLLSQVEALSKNLDGRFKRPSEQDMQEILDLRMKLVYLSLEEGDDNAAGEGFIGAAAQAVTVCSSNIVAFFNVAEVFIHLLDRPRLGLSQPLGEVADMAMRFAKTSRSDEYLSVAYLLAALHDREVFRPESCLTNVLASVWYGQRHQASESPSVLMRSSTKHRLDERRAFAADTALELGQTELLAELIEGARLQALAETEQVLRSGGDDLLGLLGATETSLQDVHPVSVNGRSRVAEASGALTGPVALPLEPAITAVGGPGAVYWGSWAALGKCYWVVRTADGSWTAGALELRPSIVALLDTERDLRSTDSTHLGMFDDDEQELSLARELGRAVLPTPLVDAVCASTELLSLVVAGSFVCDLPLPALALPGSSDERLIERAVIRVQPPLVLAKAPAACPPIPADDADRLIVRLACLDAAGDLPYSRNYDIPCELLLTSPSKDERAKPAPPWSRLANRANLAAGLQRLQPGESAVFVYSGHVRQNGVADGPETSLVLEDGLVSAAELAAMPIPSHVVLSACSSSGAGGTGAGEWLGLAGSLLRGGAQEIVATSWPILDSEFTAGFERDIVARICADGDAASALRQSQLEALANWRHRHWEPGQVLRAPLPRTWAAFQTIGATRGREYDRGSGGTER